MQLEVIGKFVNQVDCKKKGGLALMLLGYSGLIYYLSSQVWQGFQPVFDNQDKLEHILAFGFMAFVAWTLLRQWSQVRYVWLWAWIYTVIYGLCDEWHQLFVPGRYADVADLLADAIGAALAICLLEILRARHTIRRNEGTGVLNNQLLSAH
ncbi:MAG: VanZ family protein [Magnetococcales bacterium]|nr:VanZ family protein [Magnetococcales bacterium]